MTKQKQLPFDKVISALFHDDELLIHNLFRLSDMSPADFETFKKEWPKVNEERRLELARHMSDLSEDNYLVDFTPVFAHLFGDPSPIVRIAALDGVWDSENLDLVNPMLTLLHTDEDVSVRAAAARALAHYILLAEWGQIDGSYTDEIVSRLLAEYDDPKAPIELKRAALEAVSPAPHPRIYQIINDAYEDGSDDLQLSAIFAMGVSADERWLPVLEHELNSPSPDFRAEAARACGIIGNQDTVDMLEQLLNDDDVEVGMAAIYAMGQIGGERVFELLSRIAEDPEYEVYYDAIDEALDEMEVMGGGLEMLFFPEDEDDSDDDILDELRLN